MIVDEGGRKLAKIRVAPPCKEDTIRRLKISQASLSSLPSSLARLGVFKVTNISKSRSIQKRTRTGTDAVWELEKARLEQEEGPATSSEKLAVLTTERGLEEYRRQKRAEQNVERGESFCVNKNRPPYQRHAPLLGEDRYRKPLKKFPQGGIAKIDTIGVRRTQFPRRCKALEGTERPCVTGGGMDPSLGGLGKWEEGVVTRLCDPKLFTGTASSGQPPTLVDLEAGAGVLLKDMPKAVKDSIGAQEVSWRLRLAERL